MKALWGLPEKVIYCKKCVVSNQRPGTIPEFKNNNLKNQSRKRNTIGFKNDICTACLYHEYKYDEWARFMSTSTDWDNEMYMECLP